MSGFPDHRWLCPRCGANNMLSASRCFQCAAAKTGARPRRLALLLPLALAGAIGSAAGILAGRSAGRSAVSADARDAQGRAVIAGREQVELPSAPAPVAAMPRRLPAQPSPVTARTGPPAGGSTPLAAPSQPQDVPPPLLLSSNHGSPAARGVTIVTDAAAPPPAGPGVLNSEGWVETPIEREKPEVRIHNDASRGAVLLLQDGPMELNWSIGLRGIHQSVMPGTYRYSLLAGHHDRTGQPDQVGRLTCRKYRLYELWLVNTVRKRTHYEDLGDPDPEGGPFRGPKSD